MRFIPRSLSAMTLVSTFAIHAAAMASGANNGLGNYSAASYDVGEKVFNEQVVCESRPHGGIELVPEQVAEILPDLASYGIIGQTLTLKERKSVKLYVKKRFNL